MYLHPAGPARSAESPVSLGECKTFLVQGNRTDGLTDGRADGFSETSSMFAAAKVVSSARPLAGHAVTLAHRVLARGKVHAGRRRACARLRV